MGLLWNCWAFSFESANHFSVCALSGTFKRPGSIADKFITNKQTFFKEVFDVRGATICGSEEDFFTLPNVFQPNEKTQNLRRTL